MTELDIKNKRVIVGGLVSALLLSFFIILKYFDFKGLDLDLKWIMVCGVPILISVFISGFVKSFKGFGVELEANLEEPIGIELLRPVETIETYGFQKSSLDFLFNLNPNDKRRVKKLAFISGKTNHYDLYAVEQYIRQLESLEFLEITTENGSLNCLLIAKQFYRKEGRERIPIRERIELLLRAIENKEVFFQFPEAINRRIKKTDSIIDAYQEFNSTSQGKILFNKNQILPVVDDQDKMIGLIDRRTLEELISQDVLRAMRK